MFWIGLTHAHDKQGTSQAFGLVENCTFENSPPVLQPNALMSPLSAPTPYFAPS